MNRRLHKRLAALETKLRKLEGVEDELSPAALQAYGRFVDALAEKFGTQEWRLGENHELQPLEHNDDDIAKFA